MEIIRHLPPRPRLRGALELVAGYLCDEDRIHIHALDLELLLVDDCSVATNGQQEDKPICYVTVGLIQVALLWAVGSSMDVEEIACKATGAPFASLKSNTEAHKIMQTHEWTWKSFDGLDMFGRRWETDGDPRAVILLVHGLGEHCGRYEHVAQMLTDNGYSLISFDLRGHGKSGGQRGHASSFEDFMKDIDSMFAQVADWFPGKPQFIYGHSLGGILVLNYVLRRKPALAGAIVTSPGLRTALEEQKAKVALAKILGALLPSSGLPSGLDASAISRDPEVVRRYREDPLVHDKITFGMARGVLEAINWAFAHAAEFPLPLLLMHGTADQIAYDRGSREFAAAVKGDCTLKLWEGLTHETHNEPEKEQVFQYLLDWLAHHV